MLGNEGKGKKAEEVKERPRQMIFHGSMKRVEAS
jgi:hypothetical protein